ncbi:MAG: hypothetical protein ACJAUP_001255 [Cellvibrionaceae bacterium]|jgi:hypothetical protein
MNTAATLTEATEPVNIKSLAMAACQLIAPVWPLDQFIAVNP